jgi:hypothetical protein
MAGEAEAFAFADVQNLRITALDVDAIERRRVRDVADSGELSQILHLAGLDQAGFKIKQPPATGLTGYLELWDSLLLSRPATRRLTVFADALIYDADNKTYYTARPGFAEQMQDLRAT